MFNQNEIENAISCVQKENIKFKKYATTKIILTVY